MSLANSIIATTKGYDDLYPENPSVVSELRHYSLDLDLEGLPN